MRVKVVDPNVFMSKMKHVSMNWHSILEQIQGGGEQNNKRKLIQFAFILCYSTKESQWLIMKILNLCLVF